ncbi:ATP-binding cassette domain-containing protein [Paenibacillus daejeonensis]|uniref:ATP-binding cassette domain-containing protein n=1 Tax=Paenibacillus daejeonensis TaxID=135193 RepID=UPI000375C9E8|nr:ATP-binding cassette domain-containing protein [Paenibacillus daejeonensis]
MASTFRKNGAAAESLTPEYRVAPERHEAAKGLHVQEQDAPQRSIRQAAPAGAVSGEGGVALRLREVSKRFGTKYVLSDLSLDIEPGSFVAIVGRSGCGKSTLLRLLSGLDGASEGELTRDGKRVKDIDADTRFMFQDARLLPWQTVIDNVKIGLASVNATEAQRRAEAALELVGLADRANEWPSVLSGGQRQRVALARALVGQPHLLLFDEPLGALDALTRIDMQQLIESLWTSRGFTAVLVTHDVSEAVALADRVILIDAGRIALDIPITLARPRVKDSGFAHFEQLILNRVLQTGDNASGNRERSDFDI